MPITRFTRCSPGVSVEDDNIASLNLSVVLEESPMRRRSNRNAIHKKMIADQQSVFHRAGGDLECLNIEGQDEKACRKHHRHRRKKLHGRFLLLFRFGTRARLGFLSRDLSLMFHGNNSSQFRAGGLSSSERWISPSRSNV